MPWYVWIIVAVVALVGEVFSLGLYLACFALAALATAAIALVAPLLIQIGAFAALSLLLLFAVRPVVLPLLPGGDAETRPQLGPVGRYGTVVERIGNTGGQIRVGRGEFWSARLDGPARPIDVGQEIRVVRMEGLVAVCEPVTPEAPVLEPGPRPLEGAIPYGLSEREVEVLRLMGLGMTNQEIADRLVLSPRTVHHHVSHILNKMGADSRVDAVRLGIARGIVQASAERE